MILKKLFIDRFILIITPFLFFLIFWNIGNQYLWYDESQTAVLTRSVLRYGYPKALIGDFYVSTDETYGPSISYIAQPWLQNYLCAISFIIFGESTWSARILFSLFGLLSFYLLYILALRLFKNKLIACLSLIIGLTCIPFLLHLRQCRYYSLANFFTMMLLISYIDFLNRRKYSSFLFIMSSFFLFQTNFGCLIPVLGALAIHFFFLVRDRSLAKRFIKLYLCIFFLILPWVFVYKIWEQGSEDILGSVWRNAKFYLSKINGYFFPYRFLAVVLALIFLIKRKIKFPLNKIESESFSLILLMILTNWIFLCFADYNSVRYIIHIVGLFFLIEAFLLTRALNWNRIIGIALFLALCFTDLLNSSFYYIISKPFTPVILEVSTWVHDKGIINDTINKRIQKEINKIIKKKWIKIYFFDYLYEITHDYNGPMEGVVTYLKQNAKPGQTIKTHSFNANSLFFYTDLKIDYDFSNETFPEWIFLRDYWTEDSFYKTDYFKKIEKRYKKIELDYPDIRWENRPDDMSFHYFKTAPLDKKIALYRRIE